MLSGKFSLGASKVLSASAPKNCFRESSPKAFAAVCSLDTDNVDDARYIVTLLRTLQPGRHSPQLREATGILQTSGKTTRVRARTRKLAKNSKSRRGRSPLTPPASSRTMLATDARPSRFPSRRGQGSHVVLPRRSTRQPAR